MREFDITHALKSLHPEAEWEYHYDDESLIWLSPEIEQPTQGEIEKEISRLIDEAIAEEIAKEEQVLARQAAKESALAKLALLGLTEEEAKAVIGID